MIGANLLRYNKEQKYIVCDLETEGLNLIRSRPYQLSFATYTIDKDLEEHNYYIWWPDLKMSRGAAIITRFNYDYYKSQARDPKEILDIFESYLYNPEYIVSAQNWLGYDNMILNVWRRELGLPERYDYLPRIIDTNCVSKALKKGFIINNSSPEERLISQYKLCDLHERTLKSSLTLTAKELGLVFDESTMHDALSDIRVNKEVNRKQLWLVEL